MTITKPTVTNSFTANTFSKASEVNANFTDILDEFEDNGYIAKGWIAIDNASFEYQASNAIKTTADVDLTGLLQVGDKLTFEQATDGEKFFFITAIDYNSTVANRTYIEVYGGTDYDVDNEAITADTVGLSRIKAPFGFPMDPDKWSETLSDNSTAAFRNNATLGEINSALRLSVPTGAWKCSLNHHGGIASNSSVSGLFARMGLSTSTSSFSHDEGIVIYRTREASSSNQYRRASSGRVEFYVDESSSFTLYILGQTIDANTEITPNFTTGSTGASPIIIRATIAYL